MFTVYFLVLIAFPAGDTGGSPIGGGEGEGRVDEGKEMEIEFYLSISQEARPGLVNKLMGSFRESINVPLNYLHPRYPFTCTLSPTKLCSIS